MTTKMAAAVTLAKIAGTTAVDRALGDAALHGPFAHSDLASILNANTRRTTSTHTANEATSLTQGTRAWAAITTPTTPVNTTTATSPVSTIAVSTPVSTNAASTTALSTRSKDAR